jgi:predicted nucleotidyltransferase
LLLNLVDGYLSIVESDGQIGCPVDDVLDISGWDLQKTLRLVRKCNASPFEWLQSPIVYREEAGFRDQLWTLCQEYFNPKALIFHYLGIAKGALSKTNQDGNLSVKKFFYVIRPVLAALWTQKYQAIPPMNIEPLSQLLPKELDVLLKELITMKSNASESMEFKTPEVFLTYIQETMQYLEAEARNMEDRSFGHQTLDKFLRTTIEKYDH